MGLHELILEDKDQAIYVKAGTILPILLHQNALSLLRAISNPLLMEVFVNKGKAVGMLYLDDGETFEHLNGKKLIISYIYKDYTLFAVKMSEAVFDGAYQIKINQVNIYMDDTPFICPTKLTDHYTNQSYP